MVLLGAPTQPTYQSIPSPLSPPDSGKSNVQIYPAGTTVRTWSRRPQLPNHTPAQRHGSTRSATLGKGPDRQPTRSERMLKPAAHLRSTSTRHLGPGRTQHPEPSTQNRAPRTQQWAGPRPETTAAAAAAAARTANAVSFLTATFLSSDHAVCLSTRSTVSSQSISWPVSLSLSPVELPT